MIKKIMLMFFTMLLLVSSVFAQTPNVQVDPGTTPDSPLYFLDVAIDNIALAIISNPDAKIQKELDIMKERLAEINAMASKNDVNSVAKAEKEHDSTLKKLENDIKDIEGKDPTEKLKKQITVEKEIKKHKEKVKEVSEDLKVKIVIEGNPTPEQKKIIDSIVSSLEGTTGYAEAIVQSEKEKSKTEIEKETGKNGADVEKEIEKEVETEKPELAKKQEKEKHDNNKDNKLTDVKNSNGEED